VRTIVWLRTADPEKIVATLPPQFSAANPQLYKQSLLANIDAFSKTGRISQESAETVLKNVVRFDPSIDASKINLSKTYTNDFVDRAMKKYGSSG
jgi:NitT/TauT family transport system substrate-binding protein